MLDEYFNSDIFVKDIADLDPKDRVAAMEKFTAYVAPKLQTTTLDVATETKKTIEDSWSNLLEMKRTTKNNLLLSTLDARSCLPLGVI